MVVLVAGIPLSVDSRMGSHNETMTANIESAFSVQIDYVVTKLREIQRVEMRSFLIVGKNKATNLRRETYAFAFATASFVARFHR